MTNAEGIREQSRRVAGCEDRGAQRDQTTLVSCSPEVRLVCRVLGELLAANHVRQRKAAGLREGVVQHDEPLLRKDCWHDDLEDVFVALVRVKEHERNLRPTGRSVFIAVDEG